MKVFPKPVSVGLHVEAIAYDGETPRTRHLTEGPVILITIRCWQGEQSRLQLQAQGVQPIAGRSKAEK